MDENNVEQEKEALVSQPEYEEALKSIAIYKAKANTAEIELQACKSSASYKLGHLLIHETRSFKDLLKLFSRIKAIKGHSRKSIQKGIRPADEATESNLGSKLTQKVQKGTYKKGISIVIPTYKGENTIYRVLSSLSKQNLSPELFEIIIIINGKKDNTESIIHTFSKDHPNLNISIIILDESGASQARNEGIEEASHQYCVLIDDDDSVSANYLSSMYALAGKDTIVFSQIINIDNDIIDSSNIINMQILKAKTPVSNPYKECPSILTLNACKLIPTQYMKQIKFDTTLKSGEDLAFFSELLSKFSFTFKIAKDAIYFRFLQQNSVSRQGLSFEFNIEERLLVIAAIQKSMNYTSSTTILNYLQKLVYSQITFMNVYLQEYPEKYQTVLEEIEKHKMQFFPYEKLCKNNNQNISK